MSFVVATGVSPNFLSVLQMTFPSWVKNSGTNNFVVRTFDGGVDRSPVITWYQQVPLRCQAIRDSVLEAREQGKQIVCLDADCFVLRDISSGFSPDHPFSVARWPRFNMGVIFFNTLLDFDFKGLLDEMVEKVTKRCLQLVKTRTDVTVPGDQHIWHELLHRQPDKVCKLDMSEWNFCYAAERWVRNLKRYHSRIRIAHLKGRFRQLDNKIKELKKYFGARM